MYIPVKLNVGLNMDCQQSSTLNQDVLEFGPHLAVDGNTNMRYTDGGTCTHTVRNQQLYWWTVNLGSTYTIDYITIYNREDCCSEYIFIYLQWNLSKLNPLGTSFGV
jgi:hypothetical protein